MSYILDALRRADSERERGNVPNLHTTAAPSDSPVGAGNGPRWRIGVLLVGVLALLLTGALVSRWLLADRPQMPQRPEAPVQVQAQVAAQAVPQAIAAAPAPAPNLPPAPNLQPAPSATAGPGLVRLEPAPDGLPGLPPAPAVQQRPSPGTPAAPAAAPAERPLPKASELPEEFRRELPKLVTGGSMYSSTPANRMLILNGQVFREGDSVAPNLLLEQIKLNAAVLSYKGQRFSISF